MTSNHSNLMDLMLENRRHPEHSIFVSTEIRGGQFVFIFERVTWNETRDEHTTDWTHVYTPADFSRQWRALERLGWKTVGTRKPRGMKFNSFRREVSNPATRMLKTACKLAAGRCDCHPAPLPKTRGKPMKL